MKTLNLEDNWLDMIGIIIDTTNIMITMGRRQRESVNI
jgi:hypothetical protein